MQNRQRWDDVSTDPYAESLGRMTLGGLLRWVWHEWRGPIIASVIYLAVATAILTSALIYALA